MGKGKNIGTKHLTLWASVTRKRRSPSELLWQFTHNAKWRLVGIFAGWLLIAGALRAQPFAPDRVVVGFGDDLAQRGVVAWPEGLDVRQIEPLHPNAAAAWRARPAPWLLTLAPGTDVTAAVAALRRTGQFGYAEPDYVGRGAGIRSEFFPDDPQFARQWGLFNEGTFSAPGQSLSARPGADISMPGAWAVTTGDTAIVVAVLDTGIKPDHPDLVGRRYRNPAEQPDGSDTDGNGLTDDLLGWDFINEDNDPTDDHGHGTHVTGILAATGDNGTGYAGVDWQCRLLVGKVLDARNEGPYSAWIRGIYYATDQGARVINLSLGGIAFSVALQEAVEYAHARGTTVVAASMNDGLNTQYYPAAYPTVIAVGATDPDDRRSRAFGGSSRQGSNYGPHLDLVAPGNFIFGLDHRSDTRNQLISGTSQAVPLVAGVASLLLAQEPTRSPARLREILRGTADDQVGDLAEDVPGLDIFHGYGRLNALAALTGAPDSTERLRADELRLFPNPLASGGTLQLAFGNQPQAVALTIVDATGRRVFYQEGLMLSATAQAIRLPVLPTGMYVVWVRGERSTARGRLLVGR